MKKTETLNVDMPRTLVTLNERLESRFYKKFSSTCPLTKELFQTLFRRKPL